MCVKLLYWSWVQAVKAVLLSLAQSFYDLSFHCYGDKAETNILNSCNLLLLFLSCWSVGLVQLHARLSAEAPLVIHLFLLPLRCVCSHLQLQMRDCMLKDTTESLEQTKAALDIERQQRQQIQDQLHHANKEMERLQQGVTHVRHAAEKKVIGFLLKVSAQTLCKLSLVQLCHIKFLLFWIVDTNRLSARKKKICTK